ncbi:hypothetical protein AAF712_014230 [Marasmius tenuissimus]|uniref:Uncharacterized protein n=1 Tax=Marasmius tenuissimus TaxID=585030 RepID=A0ABR2ZCM8_9AGAR
MCRYLLVKTSLGDALPSATSSSTQNGSESSTNGPQQIPYVSMDPKHKIVLANKPVQVPDPSHKLQVILQARREEIDQHEDQPDEHDQEVFGYVDGGSEDKDKGKGKARAEEVDTDIEMVDDFISNPSAGAAASAHRGSKAQTRPADDWIHDAEYVQDAVSHLMPPPTTASPAATMAVQRELKHMLKEQDNCSSFKELGWYMPPDLIGDNLFQWIVEMHSFDESLPIAKDLMKE